MCIETPIIRIYIYMKGEGIYLKPFLWIIDQKLLIWYHYKGLKALMTEEASELVKRGILNLNLNLHLNLNMNLNLILNLNLTLNVKPKPDPEPDPEPDP